MYEEKGKKSKTQRKKPTKEREKKGN